jgi:hypothetical protein
MKYSRRKDGSLSDLKFPEVGYPPEFISAIEAGEIDGDVIQYDEEGNNVREFPASLRELLSEISTT